jgi:O-antigen ligase
VTVEPAGRSLWLARTAIVLLGLACVLPFLSPVFYPPIQTFYGEAVAFALGLVAIALLLSRSLWKGVRLPRVALLFLGFAALMAMQIVLGLAPYRDVNLLGALYLLWAAMIAMLANRIVQVVGAAGFASSLAWFLVAGSLLSAAIGLIQLLGIHTPLAPFLLPQIHGRIYANTGQPNHLANYLCLGAASVAYLWSTRRLSWFVALPICVVFIAVLASSGSRGAWLYAFAFIVIAALMLRRRPSPELKRLLLFAIVFMAGLIAAQLAMPDFSPAARPLVAMETIGDRMRADMSAPLRLRFWNEAWVMFREAPVLGAGFKQFAWNNFLLNASLPGGRPGEGIIDNAHNLVFEIAAEFGACGLVLLVVGLGWWARSLRHSRIDATSWWMAATLGILGLHSMLEYPLWYAYFLGIVAMLMGAAEHEAPVIDGTRSGRFALLAAVVLGVIVFVGVFRDYRVMQSLQGAARPADVAEDGGDKRIPVLLDLQRTSLFAPYIEFAITQRMLLNRDHLQDKLVLNSRAMRFQPSSDAVYRQAYLLAMSGDIAGMQAQWDLAVANYPADRAAALGMAGQLEKNGESTMTPLLEYARRQESKAEK